MNQYLVIEDDHLCCLLITFLLSQRLDGYVIDLVYVLCMICFRFDGYKPDRVDQ